MLQGAFDLQDHTLTKNHTKRENCPRNQPKYTPKPNDFTSFICEFTRCLCSPILFDSTINWAPPTPTGFGKFVDVFFFQSLSQIPAGFGLACVCDLHWSRWDFLDTSSRKRRCFYPNKFEGVELRKKKASMKKITISRKLLKAKKVNGNEVRFCS